MMVFGLQLTMSDTTTSSRLNLQYIHICTRKLIFISAAGTYGYLKKFRNNAPVVFTVRWDHAAAGCRLVYMLWQSA